MLTLSLARFEMHDREDQMRKLIAYGSEMTASLGGVGAAGADTVTWYDENTTCSEAHTRSSRNPAVVLPVPPGSIGANHLD